MLDVVMAENVAFRFAVADAVDHRGVIEFVGEYDAAGEHGTKRRKRGFVSDVAGGHDQRRFFLVKLSQGFLEDYHGVVRAGNIAGAASARAAATNGFGHGSGNFRVLAHAEIIIAAPDGDGAAGDVAFGERERTGFALKVVEYAVAPLGFEAVDGGLEVGFVVNHAIYNVGIDIVISLTK